VALGDWHSPIRNIFPIPYFGFWLWLCIHGYSSLKRLREHPKDFPSTKAVKVILSISAFNAVLMLLTSVLVAIWGISEKMQAH
jgi:hypothetical protein